MSKKIIAIDMDDTLVWLMRAIMEDHRKKHPYWPLQYEDMAAFHTSMLHPEYNKMDFFNTPGVFRNLEIMDEHVKLEMMKLHEDYDILIVTSAFPHTVGDKWEWLQEHLPFVPHKNFITASRKDLINADLLIDDAIHNIIPWVETGRPAIVPSHHWNQELAELDHVTMIYGWHGVKEIVDSIFLGGSN